MNPSPLRALLAALLLASALAACDTGDDPCAGDLALDDLIIGTGAEAEATSIVTVSYVGRLESGAVFDERTGVTFNLGGVIAGFREGIAGMRVGGERRLTIPGRLGYGEAGRAGIPSCATLIFDVKLLEIN